MGSDEHIAVIDAGGYSVRAGIVSTAEERKGVPRSEPTVAPNMSGKAKGERHVFLADEMKRCANVSSLTVRRPFDKGYLVNRELEGDILNRILNKGNGKLGVMKGRKLLCTEPFFPLPAVTAVLDELAFEQLEVAALAAVPAPVLSFYRHRAEYGSRTQKIQSQRLAAEAGCGVVVDVGYSFTHAIPFFRNRPVLSAVRRLNLGGKALTNLMKEVVSYRTLNMMDESYIMDDVKEKLCYVAQDLRGELLQARKGKGGPLYAEYVLPDGVKHARGYVRKSTKVKAEAEDSDDEARIAALPLHGEEQFLSICNERFTIPEALFYPTDIGLQQCGVHELVKQAVDAVDDKKKGILFSNVILTGGCCRLPGFLPRFEKELRALVPDQHELNITMPEWPDTYAWGGGVDVARSGLFDKVLVTREEYLEHGAGRLRRISSSIM